MIEDMVGEGRSQNKNQNNNWKNKINKLKMDPTLNWKFAEIIDVNDSNIKFNLLKRQKKKFTG